MVINYFKEANNADFNVTGACGPPGGTLAAGASCPIWVTFNPIQDGSRYGAVELYDNAPGSPHIDQLKGTGTGSSPVADMEPSLPISFAPQNVGTASAAKTLVFYNLGNAPMTISSIDHGRRLCPNEQLSSHARRARDLPDPNYVQPDGERSANWVGSD